jgi:hypothetical protein
MDTYFSLIKAQYLNSSGDATPLFHTILSVSREIGLDRALAYLEGCVTEKRLAWLKANLGRLDQAGNPVLAGYRLFYETYLGISAPMDGEIVEQDERRMLMRWWNPCPTLAACQELGLDTRQICRKAYHQPVQAFLRRVDPRLRFDRNYTALRPYKPYCEEIIMLEEEVMEQVTVPANGANFLGVQSRGFNPHPSPDGRGEGCEGIGGEELTPWRGGILPACAPGCKIGASMLINLSRVNLTDAF